MDISKLPEPLRTRAAELTARPAIEKVRDLLHTHIQDAQNFDEIRHSFRAAARYETFFLRQNLVALETFLTEPHTPGTLLRLVEWDANWGIDQDQTDRGAAMFLSEIAAMLRSALDEVS